MSYKKIKKIEPIPVEVPENGYMYLGQDENGTWRKFSDGTVSYLTSGVTSGGGGDYWLKDGNDNLYYTTAKVYLLTADGSIPAEYEELSIFQGAITIGSNDQNLAGTLRYYGNNFWGYNGSEWINMAIQNNTGSGSDYWDEIQYGIYNTLGPVHIGWSGETNPHYALTISGGTEMIGSSSTIYFKDSYKSVGISGGKFYVKSDVSSSFKSGTGLGVETILKFYNSGSNSYAVPEDNDGNIDLGIDNTNEFEKAYTGRLRLNNYADLNDHGNIHIETTTDTYPILTMFRHPETLSTDDMLGKIEWYAKNTQDASPPDTYPSSEVANITSQKKGDSYNYSRIIINTYNDEDLDERISIEEDYDAAGDTVVIINKELRSLIADNYAFDLFVDGGGHGEIKSTYIHATDKYYCWDSDHYRQGITSSSVDIRYNKTGGDGVYRLDVVGGIVVGVTDIPD